MQMLRVVALLAMVLTSAVTPVWAGNGCASAWQGGAGFPGFVNRFPAGGWIAAWDPDGSGPAPQSLVAAPRAPVINTLSVGGAYGSNIGILTETGWQAFPGTSRPVDWLGSVDNQLYVATAALPNELPFWRVHWFDGSAWQVVGSDLNDQPSHMFSAAGRLFVVTGQYTLQMRLYSHENGQWVLVESVPLQSISDVWDTDEATYLVGTPMTGGTAVYSFNGQVFSGPIGGALSSTSTCRIAVLDGSLYLSGWVRLPGLAPAGLIRFDSGAWAPVAGPNRSALDMTVTDGKLYLVHGDGMDWFDGATYQSYYVPLNGRGQAFTATAVGINGDVYVAGGFVQVGSMPFPASTAFDARGLVHFDGSQWRAIDQGISAPVHAMTVHDGRVVIGGQFRSAGETMLFGIGEMNGGRLLPIGGGFQGPQGLVGPTRFVSLLSSYNGDLLAGVQTQEGLEGYQLQRWNGATWEGVSGIGGAPLNAAVEYQGLLYFLSTASSSSGRIVSAWNGTSAVQLASNASDTPPRIPSARDGVVYDNELIVVGQFSTVGGTPVQSIARWNGERWAAMPHPFPSWVGASANNLDSVLFARGRLWVTGNFPPTALINGRSEPVGPILRYDASGWSRAPGLQGLGSLSSGIRTMVEFGGGIVVGGTFRLLGSNDLVALARWDGRRWRALSPRFVGGTSLSSAWPDGAPSVLTLEVVNDRLFVGGRIVAVDGQAINSWGWYSDEVAYVAWQGELSDRAVNLGETVELRCEVGGVGPLTVGWYKDGLEVVDGVGPTGSVVTGARTTTLRIENIQSRNGGVYTLRVRNECGEDTTSPTNVRVIPPPCFGDGNGDRRVDGLDLSLVLAGFGRVTQPFEGADFDGDGLVDSVDLSILLATFGQSCP